MDPQQILCHNPDCPASGKVGRGNVGVHSQKQQRYICHECKVTFTPSKGSPFYRLRYSVEVVKQVITLLAYGCPLQAIVAAFGIDERTVASWQQRAGERCQQVHQHPDDYLEYRLITGFQFPSNGKLLPNRGDILVILRKPAEFQFPSNGKLLPNKVQDVALAALERFQFPSSGKVLPN